MDMVCSIQRESEMCAIANAMTRDEVSGVEIIGLSLTVCTSFMLFGRQPGFEASAYG